MSELDNEITSSDFLSRMRHTTAHVMAQAVREIFPDARMGIGPVIEDGFYYDFDLDRKGQGKPSLCSARR